MHFARKQLKVPTSNFYMVRVFFFASKWGSKQTIISHFLHSSFLMYKCLWMLSIPFQLMETVSFPGGGLAIFRWGMPIDGPDGK